MLVLLQITSVQSLRSIVISKSSSEFTHKPCLLDHRTYVFMYEIKHQTISLGDNMVLHFNKSLEQLHQCRSSNNCASSKVISGHASHMRCRKKKSRPNWITASIACLLTSVVDMYIKTTTAESFPTTCWGIMGWRAEGVGC